MRTQVGMNLWQRARATMMKWQVRESLLRCNERGCVIAPDTEKICESNYVQIIFNCNRFTNVHTLALREILVLPHTHTQTLRLPITDASGVRLISAFA